MIIQLTKCLLGAIAVSMGVMAADTAQAQRSYRDYRDPDRYYRSGERYDGRYTARRPVYDDAYRGGRTRSIVTDTPMGPVQSSKTVDPRTGREISTTYWRDPRTGQVTTSRRVVDPRTGEDRASTRTADPYSGAVQRSRVDQDRYRGSYSERTSGVDPWSGVPYRSRSTYDPVYGETYEHEDPYYGGSRVDIPYRRSWW
jgi:hypothetical protein